jgi:3-dehydroquinate dehydratase-2
MLGKRDAHHYGTVTLAQINETLTRLAEIEGVELIFFQSNHEGALVDYVQEHVSDLDGIMVNPGALTHYGYSLRDALQDSRLPVVEVHLSNLAEREAFRQTDVVEDIAIQRIMGLKEKSYEQGLEALVKHIRAQGLAHGAGGSPPASRED